MALCGISCNLFSHPACLLQSAIFHALIANQPDDTETNTDRSHCNAENVDLEGYDIQTVPNRLARSEEHTSELQSLMRISYAVFCLKKKTTNYNLLHNIIRQ